jgi:hypothetical protein
MVRGDACLAILLVVFAGAKPVSTPSLILRLSADTPEVAVGGVLKLRLEVGNPGKRPLRFDNGALVSFMVMHDADGKEIPQWPFMDILCAPPGKEAVWNLPAGERKPIEVTLPFREASWSGFGIPDGGDFQGRALEAHYPAGAAIHAIGKLPTNVTIVWRWLASKDAVRARARKLGMPPTWSGDVTSNSVEIRLVGPISTPPK